MADVFINYSFHMQTSEQQTFFLKVEAVPAPLGQRVLGLISPVYGPFHLLPTGAGPQNSGKVKVLSRVDSKED